MKIGKPEYIKQVQSLSEEEQQKILSRMSGKLPKRLLKDKLSVEEAIAIQLEIEEEQLAEWRKNWAKIKKQESDKNEKKPVGEKKAKADAKSATKTAGAASAASAGSTASKAVKPKAAGAASSPAKAATVKPAMAGKRVKSS